MIWKVFWSVAALGTVAAGVSGGWLAAFIVGFGFCLGFIPFWGAVVILRPFFDKPYTPSPDGPPD